MADIDIQRKEGPGMWPWILGAIALILVIGAVLMVTGSDDTARADRNGEPAAPAATETWPQQDPAYDDPATTPATPGTTPETAPGSTAPGTVPGTDRPGDDPRTPGTTGDDPGADPGT